MYARVWQEAQLFSTLSACSRARCSRFMATDRESTNARRSVNRTGSDREKSENRGRAGHSRVLGGLVMCTPDRQAVDVHQAPLPADASVLAQIFPLLRPHSRERDDFDREPGG